MNKKITFLTVGGDLRLVYTAAALAKEHTVYSAGIDGGFSLPQSIKPVGQTLELPEKADIIILPLPASQDGVFVNAPFCKSNIPLTSLFPVLKENGIIFGGRIDDRTMKIFQNHGAEAIDYFEREELNVLNAVPTSEGAIQIAMEEMATTIFGQKVLVTGFGRISKALVKILCAMGADVTVTARKYSDLAWAEIYGCRGLHISELENNAGGFSLIFNTIPSMILGKEILKNISEEALIIDLASKPGGVDLEAAGSMGLKVVWALSLPGKVAPISSGEIIASAILNILKERSCTDGCFFGT